MRNAVEILRFFFFSSFGLYDVIVMIYRFQSSTFWGKNEILHTLEIKRMFYGIFLGMLSNIQDENIYNCYRKEQGFLPNVIVYNGMIA